MAQDLPRIGPSGTMQYFGGQVFAASAPRM